MSKLLKHFVGIDISKSFFDVAYLESTHQEKMEHKQFKQSTQGFADMKEWLLNLGVEFNEHTLVCMEHTGVYGFGLISFLESQKAMMWVEMALRIKKTQGLERSSNDKTDAMKIAWYAYRYQDNKRLWSPTDKDLNRIRGLIAQRDRLVACISKIVVPIEELKECGCMEDALELEKVQRLAVKHLQIAKENVERLILAIVNENQGLSNKAKNLQSIKGIGKITAVTFLVYTNGFTTFETAKQLACYCGVVPFQRKTSGTSIKSKPSVSAFANKKLKWLLHMCAMSAIGCDKEIKAYYEKKVSDGKNKMSVINAVRNKLVLRMFAVVRDDRQFVENYQKRCA